MKLSLLERSCGEVQLPQRLRDEAHSLQYLTRSAVKLLSNGYQGIKTLYLFFVDFNHCQHGGIITLFIMGGFRLTLDSSKRGVTECYLLLI